MKNTLDLTKLEDRRELIARAKARMRQIPSLLAGKIQWSIDACESNPSHQGNWEELSDLLK
jgi:hypothetical protein